MHTYKLRFFFDNGILLWSANENAREKYNYPIDAKLLPISDSLKNEIGSMIDWYDSSTNQEYPPDSPIWKEEECQKFNNAKKILCKKIVQELGTDYLVIDESEDLHELKESIFPMPNKF